MSWFANAGISGARICELFFVPRFTHAAYVVSARCITPIVWALKEFVR